MRGKEYVQFLIDEHKRTGKVTSDIKGLSDEELHSLVDSIAPDSITMKAIIYSTMKEQI